MKKCSKCGVEKPLCEFHKQKGGKDGLTSKCKSCKKIEATNWYVKKRDEKRESNTCVMCGVSLLDKCTSAMYCDEHKKVKKREYKRNSYLRNLDTVIEYQTKNKEKIRSYQRGKEQERRDNLSDRYITKLFVEKHGLKKEQITRDLIEVKSIILKTKRLCKTLKS